MGASTNKRIRGKKVGSRKLADSPRGLSKDYVRRTLVVGVDGNKRKNEFSSQEEAKRIAKYLRNMGFLTRVLPIGKTGKFTLYTRRNDKCSR